MKKKLEKGLGMNFGVSKSEDEEKHGHAEPVKIALISFAFDN
jgi:hypothetical protein